MHPATLVVPVLCKQRSVYSRAGNAGTLRVECLFILLSHFMYLIYSALLAAGLLISLPYWMFGKRRHGKYREGLRERLGRVPSRLHQKAGPTSGFMRFQLVKCLQSVSLSPSCGGVSRNIAWWFRPRLLQAKLAKKRFGEESVFYFPLDFGFAIRPFWGRLNRNWSSSLKPNSGPTSCGWRTAAALVSRW